MIFTTVEPNTLGTLEPNDRFRFDNDTDTYYFIGNYGVGGFVCWNDTKKQRKVIKDFNYLDYVKIKTHKF